MNARMKVVSSWNTLLAWVGIHYVTIVALLLAMLLMALPTD
jgi:hypothetical protein